MSKHVEFEDTILAKEKGGKLSLNTYEVLERIYGEPKFRYGYDYLIFKDIRRTRPNLEFGYHELSQELLTEFKERRLL